ncbi:unnamed protein product [Notodromas monacha]|uniref:Uncharacterized protein n=1 Tax=Notodromas monacha TaxID=399045 RepID=A0A7R9BS10_9CRUS|nr:unnamed protein product [Notodromas monacha]CAG0920286.1 unnamed protein product [Notodromas monacha]
MVDIIRKSRKFSVVSIFVCCCAVVAKLISAENSSVETVYFPPRDTVDLPNSTENINSTKNTPRQGRRPTNTWLSRKKTSSNVGKSCFNCVGLTLETETTSDGFSLDDLKLKWADCALESFDMDLKTLEMLNPRIPPRRPPPGIITRPGFPTPTRRPPVYMPSILIRPSNWNVQARWSEEDSEGFDFFRFAQSNAEPKAPENEPRETAGNAGTRNRRNAGNMMRDPRGPPRNYHFPGEDKINKIQSCFLQKANFVNTPPEDDPYRGRIEEPNVDSITLLIEEMTGAEDVKQKMIEAVDTCKGNRSRMVRKNQAVVFLSLSVTLSQTEESESPESRIAEISIGSEDEIKSVRARPSRNSRRRDAKTCFECLEAYLPTESINKDTKITKHEAIWATCLKSVVNLDMTTLAVMAPPRDSGGGRPRPTRPPIDFDYGDPYSQNIFDSRPLYGDERLPRNDRPSTTANEQLLDQRQQRPPGNNKDRKVTLPSDLQQKVQVCFLERAGLATGDGRNMKPNLEAMEILLQSTTASQTAKGKLITALDLCTDNGRNVEISIRLGYQEYAIKQEENLFGTRAFRLSDPNFPSQSNTKNCSYHIPQIREIKCTQKEMRTVFVFSLFAATAFSSDLSVNNGDEVRFEPRRSADADTSSTANLDGEQKTPRRIRYRPNPGSSSGSCLNRVGVYFDSEYESTVVNRLKAIWTVCSLMALGGKPFTTLDILNPGTSSASPSIPITPFRARPNRRPRTYSIKRNPNASWGPPVNYEKENPSQSEVQDRQEEPTPRDSESLRRNDDFPDDGYLNQYDDRRLPVTQRPTAERQGILQQIQTCFLLKTKYMVLQGGTLRNAQPQTNSISSLIRSMSGNQEEEGKQSTPFGSSVSMNKHATPDMGIPHTNWKTSRKLNEGIPLPMDEAIPEASTAVETEETEMAEIKIAEIEISSDDDEIKSARARPSTNNRRRDPKSCFECIEAYLPTDSIAKNVKISNYEAIWASCLVSVVNVDMTTLMMLAPPKENEGRPSRPPTIYPEYEDYSPTQNIFNNRPISNGDRLPRNDRPINDEQRFDQRRRPSENSREKNLPSEIAKKVQACFFEKTGLVTGEGRSLNPNLDGIERMLRSTEASPFIKDELVAAMDSCADSGKDTAVSEQCGFELKTSKWTSKLFLIPSYMSSIQLTSRNKTKTFEIKGIMKNICITHGINEKSQSISNFRSVVSLVLEIVDSDRRVPRQRREFRRLWRRFRRNFLHGFHVVVHYGFRRRRKVKVPIRVFQPVHQFLRERCLFFNQRLLKPGRLVLHVVPPEVLHGRRSSVGRPKFSQFSNNKKKSEEARKV